MSPVTSPIRVVIAEEHPVYRRTVRRSAESQPGLLIVGEASDAQGAVQLIRQIEPDILLADLGLSRGFESHAAIRFASAVSPARIVVTVNAIERSQVVEAFRLGAEGVVLRTSPPQVVLQKIRSAMAGECWLERENVEILVEAFRELLCQSNGATSQKDYGLTRRELDIITKIVSGRSNRQVGEDFSISERTVKHHLTNIFGKIGVSSRLQLALFAVSHQIRSIEPASLTLTVPQHSEKGSEESRSSSH
jgi:two-component system nitrate/nitrite response regulator NarL